MCCPLSPAGLGESHPASLQRLVVFLSTLTAVISPPFHRSPLPSLPSFHTLLSSQGPGCWEKLGCDAAFRAVRHLKPQLLYPTGRERFSIGDN